MKKVLISLDDIYHEARIFAEKYFKDKAHWSQEERSRVADAQGELKLHFIDWFDVQPDAPQWKNCSHNDIPVDSQAVVVFNEESQTTGLAWMNDGFVWQDINGELGQNDLIDFWIEMPEKTGDE